jgi:hypothetical protein
MQNKFNGELSGTCPFCGKGMSWRKDMRGVHARIWERKTTGRKRSGRKKNAHAEEEIMQGQHARRPNYVRVLVRECNG